MEGSLWRDETWISHEGGREVATGRESDGEGDDEEEQEEEEKVDAEGHQLVHHAHAPCDSFEGRMEAGSARAAATQELRGYCFRAGN